MPKVEIEEDELQALLRIKTALVPIMANPQAARLAEQAIKMVHPNARTPHLDADATLNSATADIRKEFDEYRKTQTQKEEAAEQEKKIAALNSSIEDGVRRLRQAGWTDEGIKGVRDTMETRGILDVDIAAAYFEKQHPPQSPITPGGSGAWNFMEPPAETDVDMKQLIATKGESVPLIDKMAREALSDFRGQSRR